MGETEVIAGMFTSEQITSITAALTTAIGNVMSMFVDLLPIVAIITGVGFGIGLVMSLFKKARRGGRG